jgi:SAM-dependent methyltransferase
MPLSPDEILPLLRCPATGSLLFRAGDFLVTTDKSRRYPVVDDVPVLLAEERSLFDSGYVTEGGKPGAGRRLAQLPSRLLSMPPTRTRNVAAKQNFELLADLLGERSGNGSDPRVLVVGGRIAGAGSKVILDNQRLDVIETDVALGPRTQVVCDAHDLPFADGTFDAVVIQAVLEAVVDPPRVASEVHRVLRPDGLVYSEAPFMQQVHEGVFDFNRFTHLGHRLLWRDFDELRSGAQCGPGMALLWSLEYFLLSFAGRSRISRGAVSRLVSLFGFWLKYFDDFLVKRPGGIDAASGTFFLGRRRDTPIPYREILHAFRGVRPRGQRAPGQLGRSGEPG